MVGQVTNSEAKDIGTVGAVAEGLKGFGWVIDGMGIGVSNIRKLRNRFLRWRGAKSRQSRAVVLVFPVVGAR